MLVTPSYCSWNFVLVIRNYLYIVCRFFHIRCRNKVRVLYIFWYGNWINKRNTYHANSSKQNKCSTQIRIARDVFDIWISRLHQVYELDGWTFSIHSKIGFSWLVGEVNVYTPVPSQCAASSMQRDDNKCRARWRTRWSLVREILRFLQFQAKSTAGAFTRPAARHLAALIITSEGALRWNRRIGVPSILKWSFWE